MRHGHGTMVLAVAVALLGAACASALTPATPPREHTISVLVWEYWGRAKELADVAVNRGDVQSRDWDALLGFRQSGDARLVPIPCGADAPKFRVVFYDAIWKKAQGRAIAINGDYATLPADFGPGKNRIEVPVCRGEGHLTFAVNPADPAEDWITDTTTIEVVSPWRQPQVVYPKSGILALCAPATAGRCGKPVRIGEASEFRVITRMSQTSEIHFIVR